MIISFSDFSGFKFIKKKSKEVGIDKLCAEEASPQFLT